MKISKQKLQIEMAKACLNVQELAAAAQVSKNSMFAYLSGIRNPRPKVVGKLAKALGCDVTEILED